MGKAKALYKWGGKLMGGVGSHPKAALMFGGLGYGMYKYNQTGQGAIETWGSFLAGDKAVNKIKTDGVGEAVGDFVLGEGNTDKVVEKGKDLVSGVGDAVKGTAEGAGGLFGGLSNLVSGIFGGGTSSLVGLIAAGMMLFGNFGWMGKIVCGLIAAMSFGLFGGNSNQQQANPVLSPVQARDDSRQIDYRYDAEGNDEENGHVVYRPRR